MKVPKGAGPRPSRFTRAATWPVWPTSRSISGRGGVPPRRKIQIGGIYAPHVSEKLASASFFAPRAPLPFAQARPLLEIEMAFFDRVRCASSETFPSLNCAWREQASATADGKRGEDRAPWAFSKRVRNLKIQTGAFFFEKLDFLVFLVDARRWSLFNEKKQRVQVCFCKFAQLNACLAFLRVH